MKERLTATNMITLFSAGMAELWAAIEADREEIRIKTRQEFVPFRGGPGMETVYLWKGDQS